MEILKMFNHKAFTGRSGTFFAYEGLGSIYWHMVSKLLLAVQEVCLSAAKQKTDLEIQKKLYQHYYAIKNGIGVHKPPAQYGAFPTDPYSHTPFGKGAQQPGMTGQVKEDILSRFGELGVFVKEGRLIFSPVLLRKNEFSQADKEVLIINTKGEEQVITLKNKSMMFTLCQVPVIYVVQEKQGLQIEDKNGVVRQGETLELTEEETRNIFKRKGDIFSITVFIHPSNLLE